MLKYRILFLKFFESYIKRKDLDQDKDPEPDPNRGGKLITDPLNPNTDTGKTGTAKKGLIMTTFYFRHHPSSYSC